MDEQAATKAHHFLNFRRNPNKKSKKAGVQQREATSSLIPKSGHNTGEQSTMKNEKVLADHLVETSQQLVSTDYTAARIQTTEKLTFWERAKLDEDIMAKHNVGDEAHMRKFATVRLEEMQMSTIVQIVEKFSGFLGSVAALDTSQHAGLAWAGVCVLLPLITNDTKERQIAIDGIEVMTRITARYTTSDRDYTSGSINHDPSFEKALVRLYRKVTLFYMKASCYFARSTFKRTLRGTFAADSWTSAQSAVEQADKDCHPFTVSLGLSTLLGKPDGILDSLREIQLDDHIDRVKKWLVHDVDVEYQHASTREKLGAQYREPGKWLLDSPEFQDWIQGSQGQFWIQGVIGTGKTSLVSIVQYHVKQTFENLAFFYFSGSFADSASGKNMHLTKFLRALIEQLALSPNGDRIAEEEDLYFTRAVEEGTLRSPTPLDFQQASELLVEVINSRDETILILDGLDEFPSFVSLLSSSQTIDHRANNLKILFSSQYVDSFPDMKMFVEGELRRFQVQRPNLIDETLAADIIETLPEKAEGTFKWAELTLKAVLDPDSEINAKEINTNWQSIKSAEFQWATRDFIQIYEDDIAESTDGVSEVRISKICRNFLFLSDEGTVTLSHSSARDYLSLKLSRRIKQFLHTDQESNDVENTDENVLRIARETSLQLASSRICTECLDIILDSKNWTKEESEGSPLLTYACKFWPKHAALCNDKYFQDEILAKIKSLFHMRNSDTFRRWVSVFDAVESFQLSKEPDPSYYAVILEMPDIVQFCLDQGSSATSRGGKHGFPLQTACYLGNMTIFSLMISGTDINSVDNVYGTPLQASIAGKQKAVSISLISNFGADVNLRGGTFGTAQQMALALNDLDLLAFFDAHGSRMEDENGRGQAWATAWESNYATIQRIRITERLRNLLRIKSSFLPLSVDSDLQLLAICIHTRSIALASSSYQDFMLRAFGDHAFRRLAEYKGQVREYTALVICSERMREEDLDCRSFIPRALSWLVLLAISVDGDVDTMELIDYLATSIGRQESFLSKYPDYSKHSALRQVVAEYFAQILSHLLSSPLPVSRTRILKRLFKGLRMKNEKENIINSLSPLAASAIALEDSDITESKADDDKAWQQNVKSFMDDMKGEIKEMRETILDLKRLIETLIMTRERNTSPKG
ncbi:ankyrin repeat-containing protein [Penicillium malachiteum]|uniref:ankyrin repeat-containing protein n=1 Tax=Penicillium malachiteum TaxID=1324776 RepID=UPI002548DBF4|nr:ankyrin repeat-containing protein [Penicillium malachiteum]KAJ5714090.1 ankyrin repeat-containing protein [Penicillium malachiteum]